MSKFFCTFAAVNGLQKKRYYMDKTEEVKPVEKKLYGIVEKVVELPVGQADGTHQLTIHPCHPGIVFEKIVIDYGGYTPQYLFGEESPLERK